jgi:hypothetical protein
LAVDVSLILTSSVNIYNKFIKDTTRMTC